MSVLNSPGQLVKHKSKTIINKHTNINLLLSLQYLGTLDPGGVFNPFKFTQSIIYSSIPLKRSISNSKAYLLVLYLQRASPYEVHRV